MSFKKRLLIGAIFGMLAGAVMGGGISAYCTSMVLNFFGNTGPSLRITSAVATLGCLQKGDLDKALFIEEGFLDGSIVGLPNFMEQATEAGKERGRQALTEAARYRSEYPRDYTLNPESGKYIQDILSKYGTP